MPLPQETTVVIQSVAMDTVTPDQATALSTAVATATIIMAIWATTARHPAITVALPIPTIAITPTATPAQIPTVAITIIATAFGILTPPVIQAVTIPIVRAVTVRLVPEVSEAVIEAPAVVAAEVAVGNHIHSKMK